MGLDIPEHKLKISLPFVGRDKSEFPLRVNAGLRGQLQPTIDSLKLLEHEFSSSPQLFEIWLSLRAQLVNQIVGGFHMLQEDQEEFLKLEGPHGSRLPVQVFQPSTAHKLDEETFVSRSHLRIKRTLLNLQQLMQAFPEREELKELEPHLQLLCDSSDSSSLNDSLQTLTASSEFETYLMCKEQFLDRWLQQQNGHAHKFNPEMFTHSELKTLFPLLNEHKKQWGEDADILHYTQLSFFRRFNGQVNPIINTSSLEFWKYNRVLQEFKSFVEQIWRMFATDEPMVIFRFEQSFTYLLLGYHDGMVLDHLLDGAGNVPIYLALVLRRADGTYRQIQSSDKKAQKLAEDCLKTALLPYFKQLNEKLKLNLSQHFMDFFKVYS